MILYWGNAEQEEVCFIRFADDTTHSYRIPVVKVQGYMPQMIEEKQLTILIPFFPIHFRRYFGKKKQTLWACTRRRCTERSEIEIDRIYTGMHHDNRL